MTGTATRKVAHDHGHGLRGIISGFWHAHMGWIFDPPGESLDRYVPDLIRDRRIRAISEWFPAWVALGFVIPALLGGLLNLAIGAPFWTGVFLGFIWGGLVRVMVVHHITWSVNSVCHIWGSQPYRSGDESRNNVVVGVLALGEGLVPGPVSCMVGGRAAPGEAISSEEARCSMPPGAAGFVGVSLSGAPSSEGAVFLYREAAQVHGAAPRAAWRGGSTLVHVSGRGLEGGEARCRVICGWGHAARPQSKGCGRQASAENSPGPAPVNMSLRPLRPGPGR